jgi:hypothetical protein
MATTMIRDAHWYALAAGERSSEGIVTGYCAQHVRWCEGRKGGFGHNSREGSDLRWHGRAKSSIRFASHKYWTGNLSQDRSGCQRAALASCAFFHKVPRLCTSSILSGIYAG